MERERKIRNQNQIFVWGSSTNYSRTEVILDGFKQHNHEVFNYTSSGKSIKNKIKLLFLFLKIPKGSIVYIPSMNHINSICCKIYNFVFRKKNYVIFDPLISRYDTLVNDRKRHKEKSFKGKIDYIIDSISMNWVDCLIADTLEHKKYFIENFNVNKNKVIEVPVGAPKVFFNKGHEIDDKGEFKVVFYGNYIPLHGIDTILKAFDLLKNYPIDLTLVGKGQTYNDMKKLAQGLELKNVSFIERLQYEDLINLVSQSDLGLGVFGTSEKAARVVPNKVFQMAAIGVPIITQNSNPVKRFFGNNVIYVEAGNHVSLAKEIINAYNSREQLYQNGLSLRKMSINNYTPELISKIILDFINDVK